MMEELWRHQEFTRADRFLLKIWFLCRVNGEMATNFLLLVKAAIDEAKGLTSGENEQRLKLNKLQCKCIVEKLSTQTQEILNSVESTCADSAVPFEPYEATFKELYRVVTDALSLIKDCCAEKWLLTAIKQRAGTNIEDFAKILYEIEWCNLILCSINPRKLSSVGRQTVMFEPEGCNGKLNAFDLFKLERASNEDRESLRLGLEHLRQDHVCDNTMEVCLRFRSDACLATPLLEMLDKWAAALADGPMATEIAVPSLWKVDPRDLHKGQSLGKGAFGKVQETTWLGEKYAKKVFPKNGNESQSLMIESDILTRICHPNVVRIVCWSEDKDKDNCSLVMDLMVSDLSKFLKDVPTPRLSILAAVGLMLQVAEGMKYLHGRGPRGFIHRDLKSLNILVRPLADAPELKYHEGYLNAKVADFGTAKIKDLSTRYSTQTLDVGTRLWMAPEMIGNEDDIDHESEHDSLRKLPFKVDVYSFAIVCAEILTGDKPYAGSNMSLTKLLKQIREHGLRPKLPESCPWRLAFLIQRCWEGTPDERPNFSEICRELRYIKGLLLRGNLC